MPSRKMGSFFQLNRVKLEIKVKSCVHQAEPIGVYSFNLTPVPTPKPRDLSLKSLSPVGLSLESLNIESLNPGDSV